MLFNTAELLKKHGHEVVFFSFSDPKNEKTEEKEYFVDLSGGIRKLKNYFYNSDAAKKLDEILLIEKPDIAHVHLIWGGMGVAIFHVLKKHRVPLVHTVHDYRMVCPAYTFKKGNGNICERCKSWNYYNCAFNRCSKGSLAQSIIMATEMYIRQLYYNPLKNIDGFIFVSQFAKDKHIEHNRSFATANSVVLYNYTKPILSPDISRKEDYYLFFGRLSYEKGAKTLVEAFGQLSKQKLLVVGTGPLEDKLKKICSDNEWHNIEFVGYKSGMPLFELIRNARFVCVPSEWYENNPMTILESYSLGTPVIGARIGGIPEIIEQGKTGFCFESQNIDDLRMAVENAHKLNEEDYSKMCEQSYALYEKKFSEDSHYACLVDFYNKTINKYHRNK